MCAGRASPVPTASGFEVHPWSLRREAPFEPRPRDAELFGHSGPGFFGGHRQTVTDHEEIDGDKEDPGHEKKTPIPEGELEPDGEAVASPFVWCVGGCAG